MNKMKNILFVIMVLISGLIQCQTESVLIEAESFQNKGGWVIDQQFMDVRKVKPFKGGVQQDWMGNRHADLGASARLDKRLDL